MASLSALLAFGAALSLSIALLVLRLPFLVEPAKLLGQLMIRAAVWATPEEVSSRADLYTLLTQSGLGERSQTAVLALRALLSAALPLVVLVAVRPDSLFLSLTLVWLAAAAGYLGTGSVIQTLRRRRQRAIRVATPTALDLLVTCLEAGLSVESAAQRVARELSSLAPAIAEELEQFVRDTQAGIPRSEALLRLPQRTGVAELEALADTLVRSERGGAGVIPALRSLAREIRTLQVLEAEGRAATAGPGLTIAMIVFLMPIFMVIIIGPALVQVSNVVFRP